MQLSMEVNSALWLKALLSGVRDRPCSQCASDGLCSCVKGHTSIRHTHVLAERS